MKKNAKIAITMILGAIFLFLGSYNIYNNMIKTTQTSTQTDSIDSSTLPKGSKDNPYLLNEEIPLNMTTYPTGDLAHPVYGAGTIIFKQLLLGSDANALLDSPNQNEIPDGYQLAILDTSVTLTAGNPDKAIPLQLIYKVFQKDGTELETKHYGFFTKDDIFLKSLKVDQSTSGYSVILVPENLDGVKISVAYITDLDTKWVLLQN